MMQANAYSIWVLPTKGISTGELIDDPKLVNALKEFLVQRAEMHVLKFIGKVATAIDEIVRINRVLFGFMVSIGKHVHML